MRRVHPFPALRHALSKTFCVSPVRKGANDRSERSPRSVLGVLIAAVLAILSATQLAVAEETRLTLPEARSTAARLLDAGDPETALILAQGVLLGAPEDVQALLLKSRALRDLGRHEEAQNAARAAWGQSDKTRDRFFSAMVMAQANASGGKRGYAQYWLRRAAEIAPDQQLKSMAVQDFRHVRRTTPWRIDLGFSLAPSDNLNGAPKSNTFSFAGLPFVNPSAVPLSGLRYGFDADYVYRFQLNDHARLNLGAALALDRVRFSDSARQTVPTIQDKDYRQDALTLSMGYERRAPDASWLGHTELSFTRRWLAGQTFSDTTRLELAYSRVLAQGLEMGAQIAFEDDQRYDLAKRDSQTGTLAFNLTRRLPEGALRLDIIAADSTSESRSIARETKRAVLSYSHKKAIHGMMPRVSLSYELVDYDLSPASFWTEARQDREVSLSVDILLPNMDFYGFAPEVGISYRDRQSNYSLYETESTDLRLGIRSVF